MLKKPKPKGCQSANQDQDADSAEASSDESKDAGQRNRDRSAAKSREKSAAVKEIGQLPPVKDEKLREQCIEDLELFLMEMFRHVWFPCRFGAQQRKYIEKARRVIREGGNHAVAMSRGWGKTMTTIGSSMWAGLNGHRKYNVIFGATDMHAEKILNHIKAQGEKNDVILHQYPEAFWPVRKLEGAHQRCGTQTYKGILTDLEWTKGNVTLPMIEGAPCAGYRIETVGITGTSRGSSFAGMAARAVRPDLIFLDDVQTKGSAKSFYQTKEIIETIDQDVMGLGGPDQTLAVLMACTVIKRNDQADQFLNTEKRPYWQGERSGMLTSLPENMKLWEQYNQVRAEGVVQGLGYGPGNEFYLSHRDELDAGCESNWPEMYDRAVECAAIQRAMNKYFEFGRAAFMAEYMNSPETGDVDNKGLDADTVKTRLNNLEQSKIPLGCEKLVAKFDVQQSLLWYTVAACKDDFTGSVIDYGWFPDQNGRREFNLDELSKSLQSESGLPDADIEGAISWGLEELGKLILDKEYVREDGGKFQITKCHVDIKDPAAAIAVSRFVRTSRWKSVLVASEGHAVGKGRLISQWTPKPGEWFGPPDTRREREYRIGAAKQDGLRKLLFDKHFWMGRVVRAFSLPVNAVGAWSLYGINPDEHTMISEHFASHYPMKIKYGAAIERTEFFQRVGMRDDLLDCVSGCMQAASQEGCQMKHFVSNDAAASPKRRRRPSVQYF